jgi:hypothetical protein
MGVPAWKSLPSWYLIATVDQAIPPDAERMFASHPADVNQLIESATETCATTEA